MNKLVPILMIAAILLSATILAGNTYAISKEHKAIDKALKNLGWKNLCKVDADVKGKNQTYTVFKRSCIVVVPPVDPICKADEHLENHKCVPNIVPDPTCKANEHLENHKCVPNPEPNTGVPKRTENVTRVAVVGDVDNNGGLTTQLNLMKKYEVQAIVIPGDFEYSDGQAVLSKLTSAGFTKANSVIAVGNHDKCGDVKSFTGFCVGEKDLGKIAFFTIDANSGFGCSGAQFDSVKSAISSSNALYKFVVIHQPFVTAKSDHTENGAFDCYNTVFKANGVNGVLQAHNHNYQRFDINGLYYGVIGTGTHDTGSSMYPVGDNWKGDPCDRCFTGTNGFLLVDIPVVNQGNSKAYFVSNVDTIKDQFEIK